MSEAIGNDSDDLLLLTMRLETDDNDFNKAKNQVKLLQDSLKDATASFNLGDFISGLNAAVQALRLAVNAWNSLEDKAINVATNRNYLPYGISAGEAESINTKIASNKTAQKVGLTSGGVLSSLISISEEQQNVVGLGHDPNQDNWVAIHELGRALGDDRFTGDNLSTLLTQSSSKEVLIAISDLLANANRKAYSLPEGSAERQKWIQMINKVQESPYVPKSLEEYIALMTKPENQTWGKSGNPLLPLFSGTPEDIGNYNESLEKSSSKSLSVHGALNYLKTERDEFWNRAGTNAYNVIGENLILPISSTLTTLANAISGKAMSNMPFEGYTAWDYMQIGNPYSMAKEPLNKRKFGASMLLDETGTYFKGDLKARAAQAKQYSTGTDNAILGELGLYELAKMSQADFAVQSITAMEYARDALIRNVTGKMTYTEGQKKGKKLSGKDAYSRAEELLTAEDSPYAQAYQSGGFTGLYAELYKNQAITAKEYLALMEKVINETKHKEINKFYSDVDKNTEVTATTKKVGDKEVLRLELTVKDEKTGETHKETTDLTPDQVASMRLNLGI